MITLGNTDLVVHPLCLGGNPFGWGANETESFAVLDAYAAAGGNFIDTADLYTAWVPGGTGGESETIIGAWMKARGNRDSMVIATKVGMLTGFTTLDTTTIRAAAEASLRRLQTDHIDLYYAHQDDATTPLEETLAGFDALVREGLVRHLGASNYGSGRLAAALDISKANGLAAYRVVQPRYNLLDRGYEQDLAGLCHQRHVVCAPYYSLARGFLTGKYRPGRTVESVRSSGALEYMDDRGLRVLGALDTLARDRGVKPAAIALAWLKAQPTVATPIASARTPEQVHELVPMASVDLSDGELQLLAVASNSGVAPA